MKKRANKIRWELAKKLRAGQIFFFKPTMLCNLKCPYCAVNKAHGRQPRFKEKPIDFWKYMIKDRKIKHVTISGGEPALYSYLPELVDWMTANKMLVMIFTNLSNVRQFMRIKRSWRVMFYSTYHDVLPLDRYLQNYKMLSSKFHVSVRELRPAYDIKPKYIPWAKTKAILTDQDEEYVEIYAPDGRLFFSCNELDKAGK